MGFIKSTSTKRGRKRERKEFKGVHITKTQIWNKRTTTGERGHMERTRDGKAAWYNLIATLSRSASRSTRSPAVPPKASCHLPRCPMRTSAVLFAPSYARHGLKRDTG